MSISRRFAREIPEVPRARHFVVDALAGEHALPTDAVLLVTSELVTNAIRHGAGQVELRVDLDGDHVRIEVLDEGHARLPQPEGPPPTDAVGGRGLHLVSAVSDRWGTGFDPEGRTLVWAELPASRTADANGALA